MTEQEYTDELARMAERYKMDEGRRRVRMVAQPQNAGNAQAIPETPQSGPDLDEYAYAGSPSPPVQGTPGMPSFSPPPPPAPTPGVLDRLAQPYGRRLPPGVETLFGRGQQLDPIPGEASMRPYEPTMRDRLANKLIGDRRLTPGQAGLVEGALGSRGLGTTEFPGVPGAPSFMPRSLLDLSPVGGAFSADERMREGKPDEAALAVLPLHGAVKMKAPPMMPRVTVRDNSGRPISRAPLSETHRSTDEILEMIDERLKANQPAVSTTSAQPMTPRVLARSGEPATWHHGISENKLRRPLEEMSATHVPTTELKPRTIVTPSELEGEIMVPLVGDRTMAGSKLTAVNEQPLAHEVTMQGGPGYMRANDALWASQKGAANTFQDTRVGKLAETTGQAPLAVYTAMSPTGGDYAHMTADTLIGMLPSSKISQKNIAKFRASMKDRGYPLPPFSTDNVDELRKTLLAPESGRAREAFVQEMARKPFQEARFPDVGSARFATTEPALLHDPSLSSGYMIGKTAPGQPTVTNPAQHMTYSTQIPGEAVGGLEFPLPKDRMWLDYYRGRTAMGRDPKLSTEDYAFRLKQPSQKATPEWVDQAEEYLRRRRAEAQ